VVKDELRSGPPNRASGHRQPDYKHVTPSGVQTDSRRYLTIEFFNKVQRTLRKHSENRNHVALSTNGETICQPPKPFNTPMAA